MVGEKDISEHGKSMDAFYQQIESLRKVQNNIVNTCVMIVSASRMLLETW